MKNRLVPLIMIIGGLLLLAGAIYLVVSANNPPAQPNIPYPEIKRVSLSDARKAYDSCLLMFGMLILLLPVTFQGQSIFPKISSFPIWKNLHPLVGLLPTALDHLKKPAPVRR
jgi:hypothetical protein